MLYSFLECILGAPKIFQRWNYKIKVAYMIVSHLEYISTLSKVVVHFNQLIFGATDTIENLEDAVDNAFNQVLIQSASSVNMNF